MNELDDAAKAVDLLESAVSQGLEPIPRENVEIALVDNEYRQPWDRQEGENAYQYKMFLHYRDQGLVRTVTATHADFKGRVDKSPKGKVKTHNVNWLYQVSTKFRWKDRAYQWDQNEEAQYQLARSEAIREMVDRHERDVSDAIEGLMTPIRALQLRIGSDPDFLDSLSQASAAKLIEMANKASRTIPSLMSAERLARGMPTEIVGGNIEHRHVVAVERDQIGEILEILDRAGQLNVGDGNLGTGEIVDAEVVDVHPVSADSDERSGDSGDTP